MLWIAATLLALVVTASVPPARPPPNQRLFNSTLVEQTIGWMTDNLADPDLAALFANCFPNTLDTTTVLASQASSFVITGDIYAMWFRDSTNQVFPYVPLTPHDEHLSHMVQGLIKRQLHNILHDAFANAYNELPTGAGHPNDLRKPPMTPLVFEGKYELDSLCAVIKLSRSYVQANGNNASLLNEFDEWPAAMRRILQVMKEMQVDSAAQANGPSSLTPYRFLRDNQWEFDIYPNRPVNWTGMVRSAFRPSDDQTFYDFLVPSNLMAVVELRHLMSLTEGVGAWADIHADAKALRDDIIAGVQRFGVNASSYFLYEVDGFGNATFMDDANMPSLLSLPFLGLSSKDLSNYDALYATTRRRVLSSHNIFFYSGPDAAGVGSPHTWPFFVWPLALMTQAVTARPGDDTDAEVLGILEMLKRIGRVDGLMHESFSVYNPVNFTRPWFAWANTMFGQSLLTLVNQRPQLLLKPFAAPKPSWFPASWNIGA